MLIPLRQLLEDSSAQLPKDQPVVVHCQSGGRSARRRRRSCRSQGYDAHNLSGGIQAWRSSQLDRPRHGRAKSQSTTCKQLKVSSVGRWPSLTTRLARCRPTG